ncbi:MAG: hypothetical protein IKZ56_12355, partial [Bacteroidales bacterium]|nr:hypothetical protein [Bacteroidales bacterium]
MSRFIRHFVALFCFSFVMGGAGYAQNQSMSGRDFWVITAHSDGHGVLGGVLLTDTLLLYLVGDTATLGTV